MKQEIKQLEVVAGNYYKRWIVGTDATKIVDNSIEHSDGSIYQSFSVYRDDDEIARIENASVVIEYEI